MIALNYHNWHTFQPELSQLNRGTWRAGYIERCPSGSGRGDGKRATWLVPRWSPTSHKASHLIADRLAERAVVIGDLSQRQMVLKKQEEETPQEKRKRQIRNRMIYNDWGLYGFVQMLTYKCLLYGKELYIISERNTSKTCHICQYKQDMPLWKRTYRCPNCGLVMDRDDNSAIHIYQRFVAGLRPHTPCGECGVLHEDGNSVEVMEASCHAQV